MSSQIFSCLVLVILLSVGGDAAPSSSAECANWESDLDRDGATLFLLGDRSLKIPATMEELNTGLCPSLMNAGNGLRNIVKKCLSAFPKTVAGLAIRGTRLTIKNRCTTESEKVRIIRYLRSIRSQENLDRLHDVADTFHREMQVMNSMVSDNKLSILCCSYVQMREDMESVASQFFDAEGLTYFLNLVDEMLREALDLACSQYNADHSKCIPVRAENPLNVTMDSKLEEKSFFLPLVRVLTSLS